MYLLLPMHLFERLPQCASCRTASETFEKAFHSHLQYKGHVEYLARDGERTQGGAAHPKSPDRSVNSSHASYFVSKRKEIMD